MANFANYLVLLGIIIGGGLGYQLGLLVGKSRAKKENK